jgi:hypothetical protein
VKETEGIREANKTGISRNQNIPGLQRNPGSAVLRRNRISTVQNNKDRRGIQKTQYSTKWN